MNNINQESSQHKEAEQFLETGIAMVYKGLFIYRQNGDYRDEYEAISTLVNMLQEDRKYLLNMYKAQINAIV